MNKCVERLYNGIIKENPTLVLTLGMCPTLAVTTSAINGIGMGLSTTAVLMLSNLFISLLRGYSRQRKNASLYRDRCIICYNNTVLITGLCAIYI
mgnify:CR=1 FL=1